MTSLSHRGFPRSGRGRAAVPAILWRRDAAGHAAIGGRLALAYLVAVLLLGGAGNDYPLIAGLLEAGALLLIAWIAIAARPMPRRMPLLATALLVTIPAVLLLQLVPLPYSLWSLLPGREPAAATLALANLDGGWRPASLEPAATMASALAMLPGFALFFAAVSLEPAERRRLLQAVIAVAALSALIGALQRSSGAAAVITLFPSAHSASSPGLFVNRNHQAAFVLVAMILTAGLAGLRSGDAGEGNRRGLSLPLPIAIGLIGLFAAGALATTSRMGLIVLPFALAISLFLLFRLRLTATSAAAAVATIVVLALAATRIDAVRAIVGRFTASEIRLEYWTDSWAAVQAFWPAGSGIGTFRTVFPAFEQLDFLAAGRPNNAHNDFLELLLEGGALAVLIFALFCAWLIASAVALARKSGSDRRLGFTALAGIVVLMLHSATDYPLRMLSLMALFGLLFGLVTRAAAQSHFEPGLAVAGHRKWIALIAGAPILYAVVAVAAADRAAAVGRPDIAAGLLPGAAPAEAASAALALEQRRFDAAAFHAASAMRSSPLDPSGTVLLGLAEDARGHADASWALMSRASSLGWRSRVAQAWTFERAFEQGAIDVAVLRADALLRQRELENRIFPALRQLAGRPGGAAAIAQRLAVGPEWRAAYLRHLRALTADNFASHEAVLRRLARTGAPADTGELNAFLQALVEGRRVAQAQALWIQIGRPGRAAGTPGNGSFERADLLAAPAPFEWRRRDLPGAVAFLDAAPPPSLRNSLRIQTDGALAGTLLSRITAMSPGIWMIEGRVREGTPAFLEALDWTVTCLDGGTLDIGSREALPAPDGGPWSRLRQPVRIPAAGCTAQRVELRVSHQGGRALDGWVDDLTVRSDGTGRRVI